MTDLDAVAQETLAPTQRAVALFWEATETFLLGEAHHSSQVKGRNAVFGVVEGMGVSVARAARILCIANPNSSPSRLVDELVELIRDRAHACLKREAD